MTKKKKVTGCFEINYSLSAGRPIDICYPIHIHTFCISNVTPETAPTVCHLCNKMLVVSIKGMNWGFTQQIKLVTSHELMTHRSQPSFDRIVTTVQGPKHKGQWQSSCTSQTSFLLSLQGKEAQPSSPMRDMLRRRLTRWGVHFNFFFLSASRTDKEGSRSQDAINSFGVKNLTYWA